MTGLFLLGQSLLPVVNALLLGSLMYRSRLVPRVLPLLGFIGAPLLVAADAATLFGLIDRVSALSRDRRTPDRTVGVFAGRLAHRQRLQSIGDRRRSWVRHR